MEGSGPSIDELLRQSFLELDQANPANDQLFEAGSQHVFGNEWSTVNNRGNSSKNKGILRSPWFWGLSGFTVLLGVVTTYYFLIDNSPKKYSSPALTEVNYSNEKPLVNSENSNTLTYEQTRKSIQTNEHSAESNAQNKKINASTILGAENELNDLNSVSNISQSGALTTSSEIPTSENSSLMNDVLSEISISARQTFEKEEQVAVKLAREKLAAKIFTEITQHYPLIPGAMGPYNDKSFQVPFYMWPNEVTVGEYTIFLKDLQLQGRVSDYEIARPHLDGSFGTLLSENDKAFFQRYFTEKDFSDYPMVFISPEGASLYCAWMQEVIASTTEASRSVVVRLPNKGEWERAAAGGHPHLEYGTFSGGLKSGVLHHRFEANFKETQENQFDFLLGLKSDAATSAHHSSHKAELNSFTSKAGKYPANSYKLYDMAGNVSEMVTDRKGNVVVKGGNWNSNAEFLRIRDDDFNEFPLGIIPCPFIGFRPVININ
jgi:formylglycine-generating enzyme required for sulfatase activity